MSQTPYNIADSLATQLGHWDQRTAAILKDYRDGCVSKDMVLGRLDICYKECAFLQSLLDQAKDRLAQLPDVIE